MGWVSPFCRIRGPWERACTIEEQFAYREVRQACEAAGPVFSTVHQHMGQGAHCVVVKGQRRWVRVLQPGWAFGLGSELSSVVPAGELAEQLRPDGGKVGLVADHQAIIKGVVAHDPPIA